MSVNREQTVERLVVKGEGSDVEMTGPHPIELYLSGARSRGYLCVACSQRAGRYGICATAESALAHLQGHRDRGERVPELAFEALRTVIVSGHCYDEDCFELAAGFLSDYRRASLFDKACLAQHVQEAVESWLEEHGFK